MSDFEKKLANDLRQSKEYREFYAEAFSNETLATQIQVLRKQRGLTQTELGERIGSNQGRISLYEDEDYGKWSLDTLRRLAHEFDLWVTVGFESYGNLVREVTHFQPENLQRPAFEDDHDLWRWIDELDPAGNPARTVIRRWSAARQPDRAVLAGWLQGLGLPDFDARQTTVVRYLLDHIPPGDEHIWMALAQQGAELIIASEDQIEPLLRSAPVYKENLFGLAAAIGRMNESLRTILQPALDRGYQTALRKYEQEGRTGLGYEGETGLVEAMIQNQADSRWKPIWLDYLTGGRYPSDFSAPGHPFLPGRSPMGIRGLLGLPAGPDYWRELASGVRDLELRFLLHGKAKVKDTPNVLDELVDAIAVIFDWWGEPSAAQELLRGSWDLIGSGSWSDHPSAAWAYGVHTRRWALAVQTGNDIEKRTFADTIASGLMWYLDWQLARTRDGRQRPAPEPAGSAAHINIQKEVDQASRSVTPAMV
jgi:transcriptional regulator with XRE-family HTH domain